MKDQMPCADYLLSLDNVDVNFPDDCGRTLLCQKLRCSSLNKALLDKATFLVEKKGADVNKADVEQWTPVNTFLFENKVKTFTRVSIFCKIFNRFFLLSAASLFGSQLCI